MKSTMIERHTYKKLIWLDISNPTHEEIREVASEAKVPIEYTDDLTTMIPHSDTYYKKGFLKITLDFPIVKRTDINHPHEIKFLVTKTHLITIRFEDIEAMHHFSKEFEMMSTLKTGKISTTPQLFLTLLDYIYDSTYKKLDFIDSKIDDIEEEIFNEHEKEMVFELSAMNRRIINFKRTLSSHENALLRLRQAIVYAFGKKYDISAEKLEHHYRRINRRTFALSNLIDDLRNTNTALLSTKQNETMKMFTILAFITFPLTLFSSMFGMNTKSTPIIGRDGDFWIIVGIMAIVSIVFFSFFRYKKWF